jgi:hypothetical protein
MKAPEADYPPMSIIEITTLRAELSGPQVG